MTLWLVTRPHDQHGKQYLSANSKWHERCWLSAGNESIERFRGKRDAQVAAALYGGDVEEKRSMKQENTRTGGKVDKWVVVRVEPVGTESGSVDVLQFLGEDPETGEKVRCGSIEDTSQVLEFDRMRDAKKAARETNDPSWQVSTLTEAAGLLDGGGSWYRIEPSDRELGPADVRAAYRPGLTQAYDVRAL